MNEVIENWNRMRATASTNEPPVYRCLHHAGYRNCAHEKCHRINRVKRKLWEERKGPYRGRPLAES